MTTDAQEALTPIHVPARSIPVPNTVSPEAQSVLALPKPIQYQWPSDTSDKDAMAETIAVWEAAIEPKDQMSAMLFGTVMAPDGHGVAVEEIKVGEISVYVATPAGVTDADPRTLMGLHGAWIYGAGEYSRLGALYLAAAHGVRVWAVDYRMPPHHPHPVPLNDCVTAYKEMIDRFGPENVAITGTSGGGNLGLALLLRAHDEGLPMPASAVLNSPYADLTHAGDSYAVMDGIDLSYAEGNLDALRRMYLDGHDPLDPYVSPVYGNYTDDLPPIQLTTGTRDFLISETCRVHRRLLNAGVKAELHCWEGAQHYLYAALAPEDLDRAETAKRFVDSHWGSGRSIS